MYENVGSAGDMEEILTAYVDAGRLLQKQQAIKGIVSRDWKGLQMILLDRLEVFIISASTFYIFYFHPRFLVYPIKSFAALPNLVSISL